MMRGGFQIDRLNASDYIASGDEDAWIKVHGLSSLVNLEQDPAV